LESGIATATVRVRDEGQPDYQEILRNAFIYLFETYGANSWFDLSVTMNVVIQGNSDQRYSVFYGQDFGGRDYTMGQPEVIRSLGDVAHINTNFSLNHFENIFFQK
jgi:hypothetical protein